MKCKYCQTELEDGAAVCPACGKEQEERTSVEEIAEEVVAEEAAEEVTAEEVTPEEPVSEEAAEEVPAESETPEIKEGIKATPGKIALAIAAGVVVLALLVSIVISGVDGDLFKGSGDAADPTTSVTEPEETEPEGTIPPDGNPDDVTCKGSYSASDEDLDASMDTVVAVVGDEELTLGQLQVYYWESAFAVQSELGSYASQFGLNFERGLDTQLCEVGDVSMTWQQYFLDYALNTWHTHQAVALVGKENGYVLADTYRTELDSMPDQIQEVVSYYGLKDAQEWIRGYIGPGCTVEDYIEYMSIYYHGYGYLEDLEQNTTFTEEELEAYFTEHEAEYADSGVTKDAGKVMDVRHILLKPENGTTGEDGYPVYPDEDWAACETEAQQMLDAWKAGDATEDSFAALAMEKSEDDGSNLNGGLYENLTAETNFVPTFKEWYLDESRQVGDTGLVKSQYGYHIMYFVGSEDLWRAEAKAALLSETVSAVLPAAKEKYPMTVDYSAIKLGTLDLTAE